MEQIKCGEVYRDTDGNFSYICMFCACEFSLAVEYEEHIIMHYLESEPKEDETIDTERVLIKIEPVLEKQDIARTVRIVAVNQKTQKIEVEPYHTDGGDNEQYEYEINYDVDAEGDEMEKLASDEMEQDQELEIEDEEVEDDEEEEEEDDDDDDDQEEKYKSDSEGNDRIQEMKDFIKNTHSFIKCECCNEYYSCNGLIQQHIYEDSHPEKCCEICLAYYEKETELNAHKKVHNLANTVSCPHCSEVFASLKKLKSHLLTKKKYSGAEKKSMSKSPVKKSNKLKKNTKKKYVCDICTKEYSYLFYLKQHLKRHTENTLNHACEVCGHEFKLRQNLIAHRRTHTGEKPFKCKLCGKAFNQPYYMTIHMRIHQKEKPYQCTRCGVSFVTSSHLGRHMKGHNNVKPHKCAICDRAFILPGHLKDHMRSQHTGERPFSCEVCGNAFSRRKLLRQHMQLHGEKKFKCKYCDLAFSQSAGRRGHEIRVHNAA